MFPLMAVQWTAINGVSQFLMKTLVASDGLLCTDSTTMLALVFSRSPAIRLFRQTPTTRKNIHPQPPAQLNPIATYIFRNHLVSFLVSSSYFANLQSLSCASINLISEPIQRCTLYTDTHRQHALQHIKPHSLFSLMSFCFDCIVTTLPSRCLCSGTCS